MNTHALDSNQTVTSKRGRPINPLLLERILHCGQAQFIQQGFEATSMEAIAQCAGVSKMTIYRHFKTKEALFEHCVATRTNQVFNLSAPHILPPENLDAVAQVLEYIASEFIKLLLDPEILAMQRTFVAKALQYPAVCQSFYEAGCIRLITLVSAYLAQAHHHKVLNINDATFTATQFLGMCMGNYHLKGLLVQSNNCVAEALNNVQPNIATFLKAYAVQPES